MTRKGNAHPTPGEEANGHKQLTRDSSNHITNKECISELDTDVNGTPPVVATPVEQMACYVGVPGEVVDQCEKTYAISRAVRLEALRRVRDLLAPYGQFKQWCRDHDENYSTVTHALTGAYSKRLVAEPTIVRLLEAPSHTEQQTIIQAQAERLRLLEAQVAEYEQRSTAQREKEREEQKLAADRTAMEAYYRAQFLREHPWSEEWAGGALPQETLEQVRKYDEAIEGKFGMAAHSLLHTALWLLYWRVRAQTMTMWAPDMLYAMELRHVGEEWLASRNLPITDETRVMAEELWKWLVDRAIAYGLDTSEARDLCLAPEALPQGSRDYRRHDARAGAGGNNSRRGGVGGRGAGERPGLGAVA